MCRYVGKVPVSVGSPLRPELLDPLMGVTGGCGSLPWVLGTEVRFSMRTVS